MQLPFERSSLKSGTVLSRNAQCSSLIPFTRARQQTSWCHEEYVKNSKLRVFERWLYTITRNTPRTCHLAFSTSAPPPPPSLAPSHGNSFPPQNQRYAAFIRQRQQKIQHREPLQHSQNARRTKKEKHVLRFRSGKSMPTRAAAGASRR